MNVITPNLQYGASAGATGVAAEAKPTTDASVASTANDATGTVAPGLGELGSAVASLQNFAQSVRRNLDFHIDDSTGRVVVQVIASDSGEVIRQIPSEEALQLAANLNDMRSLLFREQA